jgi:NAD(P)-dependent dehydrogenase (short-subunit alcohol dehydrogenase family)
MVTRLMLAGRVVLVTGAGRGIGREHALQCAAAGARVVVNDLGAATDGSGADASAAEAVVAEIKAAGGDAIANLDSVASFDGAARMVHAAIDTFGELHAVVNNAGMLRDHMLVSMSESDFDAVVAVHLKGTFNVSKHATDWWRQQSKSGPPLDRAIINTSSGSGLHGNLGQTNYAAAKAGIAAMTMVHAKELARYGVRANCIAPMAMSRLAALVPAMNDQLDQNPDFDPAKISPLVVALAAPGCPFTGQVFSVHGASVAIYQGWSIHQEIVAEDRWTPESLAVAMQALPREVPVNSQLDLLNL